MLCCDVSGSMKTATVKLGEITSAFENGLFGVNAEITRKLFYGGLSAQMLNNRKMYAGLGAPCGWKCDYFEYITDRKEDSLCESNYVLLRDNGTMRQISDVISLKEGQEYEAKLWVKPVSEKATVRFGIEGKEKAFSLTKDSAKYQTVSFIFRGDGTANATFSIIASGDISVFEASLMPTDHFYGMRRDVVEALKYIAPTSIRFPGGCAADHFDWRQSLKPVEFRKPMYCTSKWFLLPDTHYQDGLDVGLNEFMMLCKEVGAQPEYTVSLLLSDGSDAADIVEYCNGNKNTRFGQVRQSLGFDPFGIRLWYIGNEAYFFGGPYKENGALAAEKTRELIQAMKNTDPSIQTVIGLTWPDAFKQWNVDFIRNLNCEYEYVSYHNYIGILPDSTQGINGKATCEMLETNFIDGEDIGLNFYKNELFGDKFSDINICADEWNYTWGYESSNGLLFSNALQFHFFAKSADKYHIRKAQFFAPFNEGMLTVDGWNCKIESTGELFRQLQKHKDGIIVNCQTDVPDLDILCTKHDDGYVMSIVNRSSDPYAIQTEGVQIVCCDQIKTGAFSFTDNDFLLTNHCEPIVSGHSVLFCILKN